mmetsp:Transcript_52244/g.122268  ORF Transcript_52244/g.122268 Transcript_52244/m.122268 type:complete len:388 (-) Transcript_52244:30-1193(-)
MRRCVQALVIGLWPAIAGADSSVLVGSAGCDGDDVGCVEGAEADEEVVQEVVVDSTGHMRLAMGRYSTGGRPVWITVDAATRCEFVTLADKDALYSIGNLSTVASGGKAPVYAAFANAGKTLLVANYHGPDDVNVSTGSGVASFGVNKDCSLQLADFIPHSGSSVDPKRQLSSHVHSLVPGRHGLAYACDLGMDTITVYFVGEDSMLTEVSKVKVAPGSGPRHAVEHPTQPMLYVVNEMAQSVTVMRVMEGGSLTFVQEAVIASGGTAASGSKGAEIAITEDGARLFATNRGKENTVTAFDINAAGELQNNVAVEAPAFPRGMLLLPAEKLLMVAGQSKSELWTYTFDLKVQGKLSLASSSSQGVPSLPPHPAALALRFSQAIQMSI